MRFYQSKYIIINLNGIDTPVVFPETSTHADIARSLGFSRSVIGAGFCSIGHDGYSCYGESVSLNVKSNYSTDSSLLNRMLGVQEN